jgi:hypothetical protein
MNTRIAFHPLLFAANAVTGADQINAEQIPRESILHRLFAMMTSGAVWIIPVRETREGVY